MAGSFQIAIDGPVAAGKGTVSRLVAERLGFLYVDTGAMYRVGALLCQRHNIAIEEKNIGRIVPLLEKSDIALQTPTPDQRDGRLTTVLLDGEDVSWAIRTEAMSAGASKIANYPAVRQVLIEKQKEIASGHNVIMEGRDITYRVLPDAQLKIYLTAHQTVRAKRRHFEHLVKGEDISYEDTLKNLLDRDAENMNRSTDPLQIVPDAWVIDTSDLAIDKVVDIICQRVSFLMK